MTLQNGKKNVLVALAAGLMLQLEGLGATPTAEEMWAVIQAQQAEIGRLRALVEAGQADVREARAEGLAVQEQVEATALAVEELAEGSGAGGGWWERTSIGGYGELHANFWEDADSEVDLHRFVLFVNHTFNDWITLYTELEVEHAVAGEGQNGEVEVEQAFLRMDWREGFSTDVGLFLMPVGLLNEMHEPNTFHGVERNNIESRIIPTTWWEAGVKGTWRLASGIAVEAGVTSGLDMNENGVIRGGRQKVSEAVNESMGTVGRIRYTGLPGLEVAVSAYYQDDVAQSVAADIQGLLTSGHIDYRKGGFRLRVLYARWDLDGTASPDAEKQYGYYIEPAWRWQLSDLYGDIGVYYRYSDYQYFSSRLLDNQIHEIGINYWPVDQVVLKADLQDISESDQYGSNGDFAFNLGVGYQF